MFICDAHVHVWDPRARSYSWCSGVPALARAFDLDDYRRAAPSTGACVLVEADVDDRHRAEETDALCALASDLVLGVVASVRPESNEFSRELERLAARPSVCGVRRVLHVEPDAVSTTVLFRDNLERLARFGLPFDLCVRDDQLALAADLVSHCSDVQFVLDHGGNPRIGAGAMEPWASEIRALARMPNVTCKISGLSLHAPPTLRTAAGYAPFIDVLLDAFGMDRVMFGGDWPVCTLATTVSAWLEAVQEVVRGLPTSAVERLFGENAMRIYRLRK